MASQEAGGSGTNLFRGFQFAGGHSLLEGLQLFPHPLHGFFTFGVFVAHPLIAVNHKHSDSRLIRSHFLDSGLGHLGLFAGSDSCPTFQPGDTPADHEGWRTFSCRLRLARVEER